MAMNKYQKEFLKDEKEVNQKGEKEEKKFRKQLKRNPYMKDEAEIDFKVLMKD